MVTVSALATTLFLGGWQAPLADRGDQRRRQPRLVAAALVLRQGVVFIFFFIWLRGTLPRLRYDQFMRFGWKVLIPVSLALDRRGRVHPRRRSCSTRRRHAGGSRSSSSALVVVVAIAVLVRLATMSDRASRPRRRPSRRGPSEVDPFAGGYPVPPLPGQTPARAEPAPAVRAATLEATSVLTT